MTMLKHHPLDDSGFREWLEDYDGDTNTFVYGIYDSKWTELYEEYKEEIKANGYTTL